MCISILHASIFYGAELVTSVFSVTAWPGCSCCIPDVSNHLCAVIGSASQFEQRVEPSMYLVYVYPNPMYTVFGVHTLYPNPNAVKVA